MTPKELRYDLHTPNQPGESHIHLIDSFFISGIKRAPLTRMYTPILYMNDVVYRMCLLNTGSIFG